MTCGHLLYWPKTYSSHVHLFLRAHASPWNLVCFFHSFVMQVLHDPDDSVALAPRRKSKGPCWNWQNRNNERLGQGSRLLRHCCQLLRRFGFQVDGTNVQWPLSGNFGLFASNVSVISCLALICSYWPMVTQHMLSSGLLSFSILLHLLISLLPLLYVFCAT